MRPEVRRGHSQLLFASLALLFPWGIGPAGQTNNPNIALKFVPQQAVGVARPTMDAVMHQRGARLRVVDVRRREDLSWLGTRTDDDDQVHQLRSTSAIQPFVEEVAARLLREWDVRVQAKGDLTLELALASLEIRETNKAVGATYEAEARFALRLLDNEGSALWSGTGHGDATRYGRKFSNANCNEVLSDALLEAIAAGLSDPGLHDVWAGRARPEQPERTAEPLASNLPPEYPRAISPAKLLQEVLSLRESGFEPDTILLYVRKKVLSSPLSADDITAWKKAGIPEDVIRAALACSVQ